MTEFPNLINLNAVNFKNLRLDAGGISLQRLNLFIGPNGSGKSNLVNLLRLLRDGVGENVAEERGVTALEVAIDGLGTHKILDATVPRPANVSFEFRFTPTAVAPYGTSLNLELFVKGHASKVTIGKESLVEAQTRPGYAVPYCFYKAHEQRSGSGVVSIFNGDDQRKSHFEVMPDVPTNRLALSAIPQILEGSPHPPEKTPVYRTRRQLIDCVSRWQFYNASDMNLGAIRRSDPKIGPGDRVLTASGENIALVYDNLVQDHVDFEERMQKAMQAILPQTRRLRAVRSGRLSLTLEWYFQEISEPFYLNELSDGTVRMLCWALLLLSPEPPPLLVIDEPELSLHPAWMPVLAEWIKSAAERTQVIVCTHSPDLLDFFTDRLEQVYAFHKTDASHFGVARLSRDALQSKLDEGWQLGDLYRVGDPGVGGWPW